MGEKEKLDFRLLNADEIDCRISTVKESGVSLLLYKDARVDQNILDEIVGPMNWSRSHQMIGDRLYCTVSIRDKATGEWVSKQDVGTESYTEKEKGQASDSFKRACFNWGIGRELYTAPFIWISAADCSIKKNQKGGLTCYDSFYVKEIGYDEKRTINFLEIANKNGDTVSSMRSGKPSMETDPNKAKVETAHINSLFLELQRTGVGLKNMLSSYRVNDVHDLSISNFKDAMEKLKSKPDKPLDPDKVPPETEDSALPWNTPAR